MGSWHAMLRDLSSVLHSQYIIDETIINVSPHADSSCQFVTLNGLLQV